MSYLVAFTKQILARRFFLYIASELHLPILYISLNIAKHINTRSLQWNRTLFYLACRKHGIFDQLNAQHSQSLPTIWSDHYSFSLALIVRWRFWSPKDLFWRVNYNNNCMSAISSTLFFLPNLSLYIRRAAPIFYSI